MVFIAISFGQEHLLIQDAISMGRGPCERVALRPSLPWRLGTPDEDQLRTSPMPKCDKDTTKAAQAWNRDDLVLMLGEYGLNGKAQQNKYQQ